MMMIRNALAQINVFIMAHKFNNKNYLFPVDFLSFLIVHHDIGATTTSDPPLGVRINLYPSGSVLNLVSQHTLRPLKNRLYVAPFGLVTAPINPISFASSNSTFLLGYSKRRPPLSLFACFCWTAFFAAIPRLLVLAINRFVML